MSEQLRALIAADPALMEKLRVAAPLTNPDLNMFEKIDQILGKTPQSHKVGRLFLRLSAMGMYEFIAERAEAGDPEWPDAFVADWAYEARWSQYELERGKPYASWPPDEEWRKRDEHRRAGVAGTQWAC